MGLGDRLHKTCAAHQHSGVDRKHQHGCFVHAQLPRWHMKMVLLVVCSLLFALSVTALQQAQSSE